MSKAIQSSSNASVGVQGPAATPPADWLARMGSDGQGGNAGSFARWMEQHKPQAQTLPQASPLAPAQANKPAAQANARPSAEDTPAAKGPGWSATQQKLAAARSQSGASRLPATSAQASAAANAARQTSASLAQSHANANAKAEAAKAETTKAEAAKAQSAQARRAAGPSEATDAEAVQAREADDAADASQRAEGGQDDTRTAATPADGMAVVQELTPPPNVQANDPAGMMAWLASLTQGGEAGTHTEGSELASAEGEGQGLKLGQGEEGRGKALGHGRGQGHGLALGQRGQELGQSDAGGKAGLASGQGDAALQVDALLGKGREAQSLLGEGTKGIGQDVSALMAADGARVASFGQALSEARQAMPHAQASLPTPLDAPEFTQKLADQIGLWVGQARNDGPMTAELHLNPAEMGPINVKISLDGQSAHVDFAAAALETRQAIEASLSVLSSSLQDVGLSLSGGGVFSQTPQQQQAFSQAPRGPANPSGRAGQGAGEGDDGEPLGLRQVSAPRAGRLGGLDLYA